MEPAHQVLRSWWQGKGELPAPARPGEAAIDRLERRHGVRLPEDFRAYLLEAAPRKVFWDDGHGVWWAPCEIKNLREEYRGPIANPRIAAKAAACLFFADYMQWCWAWAICCAEGEDWGKVAVIGDPPERFVADSFTSFVNAYVEDPMSVR